jgi:ATP phosphoribosyltransferase
MAATAGNGNGESRLDRIEAIMERHAAMIVDQEMRHHDAASRHEAAIERIDEMIERQVLANEVAHDEFKEGYRSLLRAQVVMNAAAEKRAKESDARMTILEVKMTETTDKLNGLIATVDGFIQRPNA